jgi:hypothetical protein
LLVVRLVPVWSVWSVSGLPDGVATACRRWCVGSHRHARGGLTRWGRWLASWWGRSPAHALPGWGRHQGQQIAPLEAAGGLAGHGVGACAAWWAWCVPGRSLRTASHALRQHRCTGLAGGSVGAGAVGVGSPGGAGGWNLCEFIA